MEQIEKLPRRMAIIMDGNGRWAKARGLKRTAGHKQGVETVRTIALEANRLGIEELVLYAFSTENWKRSKEEVDYLCRLPELFFNRFIGELMENGIKVVFTGELSAFPARTQKVIEKAVRQTENNPGLILNFAINYGARWEMTQAMKAYGKELLEKSRENDLQEEELIDYFQCPNYMDLLIRTGNEKRLSNFLLLQAAYAELIFKEIAWPEYDIEAFHEDLREYASRQRRFGGVDEG